MKRFLNLELKIDQRKLHSDQTGRFRGLVFNECHRRLGGNPQTQKSAPRAILLHHKKADCRFHLMKGKVCVLLKIQQRQFHYHFLHNECIH